jgi:hypothetical protein
MEINLFNLIGIGYLGNMIAYDFTPIQPAKQKLIDFIPFTLLSKLLNCSKCLSFWIGIFIYVDLLHGAVAGLVGFCINYLLDRIKQWYE